MLRLLGLTILAAVCVGQQAPQKTEGARDLFYFGMAPKDELPAIGKPAVPVKATKGTAVNEKRPSSPAAGAAHLGLRYTLLLVNERGIGQSVDPDRNFHKGECLAMDLESNRSGYLYVLAKQSGGDWIPLFPSPGLAEQNNRIDPGQSVRAPKGTCFEIEDPPGTEDLFVVLSRAPQDIDDLVRGMQGPEENPSRSNDSAKAGSAGTIDNAAVEHMAEKFGTRELVFSQIVKPAAKETPGKAASKAPEKKQPEQAVYVVGGSGKPLSTVVTKVAIRHD